jgi:hypothetical protein
MMATGLISFLMRMMIDAGTHYSDHGDNKGNGNDDGSLLPLDNLDLLPMNRIVIMMIVIYVPTHVASSDLIHVGSSSDSIRLAHMRMWCACEQSAAVPDASL